MNIAKAALLVTATVAAAYAIVLGALKVGKEIEIANVTEGLKSNCLSRGGIRFEHQYVPETHQVQWRCITKE